MPTRGEGGLRGEMLRREQHNTRSLDGLAGRPSSFILPTRPSIHSDLPLPVVRNGSIAATRPRSPSTDSDDAAKPRPSVPLLYASAISSMSTLSSTFYQYDSTEGAPTPVPHGGSNTGTGSNPRKLVDPPMRLPAAQERAIFVEATRMAKELIVEQVRGFAANAKRTAIKKYTPPPPAPSSSSSSSAKEMRVYALPPIGSNRHGNGNGNGNGNGKVNKKQALRYTVQWQLHAEMDEIKELLMRDDTRVDKYTSFQSVLSPETVHCKTLWRSSSTAASTTGGSISVDVDDEEDGEDEDHEDDDDDGDEDGVIRVDVDDDEDDIDGVLFFSDRDRGNRGGDGGGRPSTWHPGDHHSHRHHHQHQPRPAPPRAHKSLSSNYKPTKKSHHTKPSKRRPRPRQNWLGINWWVQQMPNKLSRDRDFIVLERQCEFVTTSRRTSSMSGGGGRPARPRGRHGFVHLRHSVDLADVVDDHDHHHHQQQHHEIQSAFVRGHLIQSGLVAVESAESPGMVEISYTMEVDFAGGNHFFNPSTAKQVVLKRLLQMEKLEELLWKWRLVKTHPDLWRVLAPRVEDSAQKLKRDDEKRLTKCDRCQFKSSRFSRRTLAACRVCSRVVCGNCSHLWEFLPVMFAMAAKVADGGSFLHGQPRLPVVDTRDYPGARPAEGHTHGTGSSSSSPSARVCAHCVAEYSRPRPRPPRHHQSSVASIHAQTQQDREDHEDQDDLEDPLSDDRHYHPQQTVRPPAFSRCESWDPSRSSRLAEDLVDDFLLDHHHHQQMGRPIAFSRCESWDPSRSSRLAEDLVDDFLLDLASSSEPMVMAFDDNPVRTQLKVQEEEAEEIPIPIPAPTTSAPGAALWRLAPRESGSYPAYPPSRDGASDTDADGDDDGSQLLLPPIPRRKLSIFEPIPEPPPRKTVMLYEG